MRHPIIDTTRSVSVESDVFEFDGVERTIWSIVTRCPVNGIDTGGEYFTSREEAVAALNSMFA